MKKCKYIFVTGGVVSGLGKGITAASLGRLLKQRGLKVAAQKLDPYMNVDPGTISPYQHGEVFVTDDGAETDLDLGHYERFIDENLTQYSNLTSGKVYYHVLDKERSGGYLGQTVQVIPHITNYIKEFIYAGAELSKADIMITEIGGTTGDIESQSFLEAIRQIAHEAGPNNCLFIHVVLIPYLKASGEHKSKPAQHSVKELRALGITPNIIITRSDDPIEISVKDKISLFCDVKPDCVIENLTLSSLYEVPLMLHDNGLDKIVCRELSLKYPEPDMTGWKAMVDCISERDSRTTIAIVGKYVKLHDAYLSIIESLNHAGFEHHTKIDIQWIDSEGITEENVESMMTGVAGVIIPGGFGSRGIEGKITVCRYLRENNIPFLGICVGMHVMVIEFARNVCGLDGANSSEFDEDAPHRVIDMLEEQRTIVEKGGTMRLGAYPCHIESGTLLEQIYKTTEISERHRHRYEFNNAYKEMMTAHGLVVSGRSPDGKLVEVIELPQNDFFIAVQYHPEFKSRPDKPHPLFSALLKAAIQGCKK